MLLQVVSDGSTTLRTTLTPVVSTFVIATRTARLKIDSIMLFPSQRPYRKYSSLTSRMSRKYSSLTAFPCSLNTIFTIHIDTNDLTLAYSEWHAWLHHIRTEAPTDENMKKFSPKWKAVSPASCLCLVCSSTESKAGTDTSFVCARSPTARTSAAPEADRSPTLPRHPRSGRGSLSSRRGREAPPRASTGSSVGRSLAWGDKKREESGGGKTAVLFASVFAIGS